MKKTAGLGVEALPVETNQWQQREIHKEDSGKVAWTHRIRHQKHRIWHYTTLSFNNVITSYLVSCVLEIFQTNGLIGVSISK